MMMVMNLRNVELSGELMQEITMFDTGKSLKQIFIWY